MRSSIVWNPVLKAVVALPLVAACATANPGGQHRLTNAERLAYIRDSLMSARDAAGEGQSSSEPKIRIIPPTVLNLNQTVEAAVRVSEDAYIFVVATDRDGRARVVFPESPQESGFVRGGSRYRLPSFFAGFGSQVFNSYSVGAFYTASQMSRPLSGAIIAVASDRPLQLARLANKDGDWDEIAIERLAFGRNVQSAAYALGDELALTGQQFDTDFSGLFESAGTSRYASLMVQGGCMADQTDPNNFYGPPATRYFTRNGTLYAVVVRGDPCSGYVQYTIPVGPANTRPDSVRAPESPADSNAAGRAGRGGAAGRFDDVVARARRSTPVADEAMRLQPTERPSSEPSLRFRPPEQLRAEPRTHERPNDELTRPAPARDDGRLRPAPVDRTPPRGEPYREPPRQQPAQAEPVRTEPAHVEAPRPEPRVEAPRVEPAPRPAPAPSTKPSKND